MSSRFLSRFLNLFLSSEEASRGSWLGPGLGSSPRGCFFDQEKDPRSHRLKIKLQGKKTTTCNNKHFRGELVWSRDSLSAPFKIKPSIWNSFESRETSLRNNIWSKQLGSNVWSLGKGSGRSLKILMSITSSGWTDTYPKQVPKPQCRKITPLPPHPCPSKQGILQMLFEMGTEKQFLHQHVLIYNNMFIYSCL